ncbi:MAG TPA: metallophosphoesterase [Myxococcota bacterium]|nr:metallophosphoesterase [Myxococcota bacterium]
MALRILDPELFGVSESSLTLSFVVADDSGPVDAEARVRVGGERRATSRGIGTRLVRIEGLEPDTGYEIGIEADGAAPAAPDRYFPGRVTTLAAPRAAETASFATLNDLHFGEPRFGGTLLPNGDYGPDAAGFPSIRADESEVPYWRFMNEDAIAEINAANVDATFIKGDIADVGRPDQFAAARDAFAKLARPHHAFLGNHDYYGRLDGLEVDGYALLGQPPAPRAVDLGGWRLLLLETALPGEHHGVFEGERLDWLAAALEETRESRTPTLLLMHHQPVPPEHADSYPNTIGIRPDHSLPLFDLLGRHPQLRGVLIGHTHRNRVRRYRASGRVPFIEVNCTKDYPGGYAHYRLFEDGSFRQEVRRTGSARALAHSSRCRDFFRGGYRDFALGSLAARSFVVD